MKPVRNSMIIAIAVLLLACNKESFTTNPAALLRTSTDTLHFDTVFTSTGSVTRFIKIINDNDEGIHLSSVRLGGGASSPFKINVDGESGPAVNNFDIGSNDSIYVFVTVNIQPNAVDLPFLVRDSIEITYNGNKQIVQLDAYRRNANFLRNHIITGSVTWNDDLPYVILGRLTVDTNAVLNINEGCRIYMHADAPFIVNGTLNVQGGPHDSSRVIFSGDRLDEPYRDFPAAYPGIWFTDVSRNNLMSYATIKNAYQGIVVTEPAPGTKLRLNETIIENAYDAGILGINSSIAARNVLISNCGKNIMLVNGGNYDFTHCTAASYSSNYNQHRDPVLLVTNYLSQSANDLNAIFRNCIFWGEVNGLVPDEVKVLKQGSSNFNVVFDQVLWRVQNQPSNAILTGIINNQDPKFDSINTSRRFFSFRLKDDSPALNKGVNAGITTDLDGKTRPVGLPDLGAYEKQ